MIFITYFYLWSDGIRNFGLQMFGLQIAHFMSPKLQLTVPSVSYTHLTLPTKLEV